MNLESLIAERLAPLRPTTLEVTDDGAEHVGHAGASGGGHFSVLVVSDVFIGLSRLGRHQTVYGLLSDLIPHRIHALSIRALAPDEF